MTTGHAPTIRRRGASVARAAVRLLDEDPFRPEAGMVYWVETTILPGDDPDLRRAVVVLAEPRRPFGTVRVAVRSGPEDGGIEHPGGGPLGFSGPGRFSSCHPVQSHLWTAQNVAPVGPLDEDVFAAVREQFA